MAPIFTPAEPLLKKYGFCPSLLPGVFISMAKPGFVSMLFCFQGSVISLVDERLDVDYEVDIEELDVMEMLADRESYEFRLNKVHVNDDQELEFMLRSVLAE
jgi:hypothetical protein